MPTLRPRQAVCKRWPQRPYLACLPLKLGGFSRPSLITHCGVSSRPQFPQDKEGFFENHRMRTKWFSFSRSLRVSSSLVEWQSCSCHYCCRRICPDKKIYPGSFIKVDVIFPSVDTDVLSSRLMLVFILGITQFVSFVFCLSK